MKVIFMGTPEFAIPSLRALYKHGYDIKAVVTQPDRPKGRGKKVLPPPIKIEGQALGLKILQPHNIKEQNFINIVKSFDIDCIIVVAYGQILPKEILNYPPYGCINVHASLLPKYRGAAPINWAIINGDTMTGVTTMYMSEGLDTGDILLKDKIKINNSMTAGELHDILSELGADVLIKTLELVQKNLIKPIPQDDSKSTYAPMLDKKIAKINWNSDAINISNIVRGLNPWPVACTTYKNSKVKIWKAQVIEKNSMGQPGEIIYVNKEGIFVCTKDKILIIKELQFPNSRRMTVEEYIRGNDIEIGIILGE